MCKLVPYKNGRRVAEIKVRHIDNIAAQAEKCRNINRIMLFGSSLEERCTSRSDIDIAVFWSQNKARYLRSKEFKSFQDSIFLYDLDQDYDIIYFCEWSDHKAGIMEDINNGIEIYRRGLA